MGLNRLLLSVWRQGHRDRMFFYTLWHRCVRSWPLDAEVTLHWGQRVLVPTWLHTCCCWAGAGPPKNSHTAIWIMTLCFFMNKVCMLLPPRAIICILKSNLRALVSGRRLTICCLLLLLTEPYFMQHSFPTGMRWKQHAYSFSIIRKFWICGLKV